MFGDDFQAIQKWGELGVEECLTLYRRCKCTADSFASTNPLSPAPVATRCTNCTEERCTDLYYNLNTQVGEQWLLSF